MSRLAGKAALVTGAGQGIGRSIATTFGAHGARVVVATRTESSGAKTVEEIRQAGGDAELVVVDVGRRDEMERAVEQTVQTYGRLDVAVHNAASFRAGRVDAVDDDALAEVLDVNLKACFWLTAAAVPHMRNDGGGRLLFTSSVTGVRVVMAGSSRYAASKAGMNGFIRSAALELAPAGITVNGVEPGFIRTPGLEVIGERTLSEVAQYIPMGSIGQPSDVAHAMLYLASDEASYVTGQTIVVDGGSTLPESPLFLTPWKGED